MSSNIQSNPFKDLGFLLLAVAALKTPEEKRTEEDNALLNDPQFMEKYARAYESASNSFKPSLKTKVCTWITNHRVATTLIVTASAIGIGILANYFIPIK